MLGAGFGGLRSHRLQMIFEHKWLDQIRGFPLSPHGFTLTHQGLPKFQTLHDLHGSSTSPLVPATWLGWRKRYKTIVI
ncbi:MAG: hypothetical protein EBZ60_10050 [Betaproteobacteria bacterium]|nr:hypothetical protein [Betaproteobacteria bacterium]